VRDLDLALLLQPCGEAARRRRRFVVTTHVLLPVSIAKRLRRGS
jgi:hypothetical protein